MLRRNWMNMAGNRMKNWVVNTMGVGIQTAKRIVKALEKNKNVNKPKLFWRE